LSFAAAADVMTLLNAAPTTTSRVHNDMNSSSYRRHWKWRGRQTRTVSLIIKMEQLIEQQPATVSINVQVADY